MGQNTNFAKHTEYICVQVFQKIGNALALLLFPLENLLIVMPLRGISKSLHGTQQNISQSVMKAAILMGNEGDDVQITICVGVTLKLKKLRLQNTASIISYALWSKIKIVQYRRYRFIKL